MLPAVVMYFGRVYVGGGPANAEHSTLTVKEMIGLLSVKCVHLKNMQNPISIMLPKGVDRGLQRGEVPGYNDADFPVSQGEYKIMQT